MANIDIELDEENLVEKDGRLFRQQPNGVLVEISWSVIMKGFKKTDLFRAQNIVQLRRDKLFNDSGIDVDSVINTFFKGAAGKMLNELIIEEFDRLKVDITDVQNEDKDFMRYTSFIIPE